jgi:drug/metabolite transporter (DMT)-like permease
VQGTNVGLAVLAALGSALCFATSSVLQQRGAARAPRGTGLHLDLLRTLITRPVWLAGMGAAAGTLALQAIALGAGQLTLVQPLSVTGLLFALPMSMLLERQRPRAREWLWAVVLVAGLAAFLLSADPRPGPRLPDDGRLWQLGVLTLMAAAGVAALGLRPGTRHRAALLGGTTGLVFGVTAALLKFSVVLIGREGPGWLLASWPCYALVVVGAAGILLNQAAFQSGPLCGAMPTVAITEPLTAVVFGVIAFGEHVQVGPLALLGQAGGFVVMACAIVQLARHAAGRHPVTTAQEPQPVFRADVPAQRLAESENLAPAA